MCKTIVYNNCSEGDWVVCNNCGKKILVPYGADKCPECGSEGTLEWAYGDDYAEVNTDLLEILGEETEKVDRELQISDYCTPETIEEILHG